MPDEIRLTPIKASELKKGQQFVFASDLKEMLHDGTPREHHAWMTDIPHPRSDLANATVYVEQPPGPNWRKIAHELARYIRLDNPNERGAILTDRYNEAVKQAGT
jgi:hypothetical protein